MPTLLVDDGPSGARDTSMMTTKIRSSVRRARENRFPTTRARVRKLFPLAPPAGAATALARTAPSTSSPPPRVATSSRDSMRRTFAPSTTTSRSPCVCTTRRSATLPRFAATALASTSTLPRSTSSPSPSSRADSTTISTPVSSSTRTPVAPSARATSRVVDPLLMKRALRKNRERYENRARAFPSLLDALRARSGAPCGTRTCE